MRRFPVLHFVVVSTVAFAMAYLISGGLSYQLLTKPFYVGADPIFAQYLAHTSRWLVPALLLRSLLVALALLPFREALARMTRGGRVAALFALVFVLQHLAAGAPSPSNIEGFVSMKPALVTARAFLLTQPEMILQALLFAAAVGLVVVRKPAAEPPITPG